MQGILGSNDRIGTGYGGWSSLCFQVLPAPAELIRCWSLACSLFDCSPMAVPSARESIAAGRLGIRSSISTMQTGFDLIQTPEGWCAAPPTSSIPNAGVIKLKHPPASTTLWSRHNFVGAVPSARSAHTMTVINSGSALLLFGGCGRGSALCNDVFFIDITSPPSASLSLPPQFTPSFQSVSLMPVERLERRIGHTAIALASGTSLNHSESLDVLASSNVYIFGGWNGTNYLNYGCLLDVQAVTCCNSTPFPLPLLRFRLIPLDARVCRRSCWWRVTKGAKRPAVAAITQR